MSVSPDADRKPVDILREAIKLLSTRKLPPTPVNYQAAYHEIAGIPDVPVFPEERLAGIAAALPAETPEQKKQKGLLEQAVAQHDWDGVRTAFVAYSRARASGAPGPDRARAPAAEVAVPSPAAQVFSAEFLEQLARLIENTLPALGTDDQRLTEQLEVLVAALRAPGADPAGLKTMLANFSHRLSFAAEDQAEIRTTLLGLLHHVFANIGELSLDDRWLRRQVETLMAAATPPLTLRRLDDLERRLKDVMFKQIEAKGRMLEAQ